MLLAQSLDGLAQSLLQLPRRSRRIRFEHADQQRTIGGSRTGLNLCSADILENALALHGR
jgi:hypothetical protein